MIDHALLIWGLDPSVYQPEIARTTFLKGQLLRTLGKPEKAEKLIEKATVYWNLTTSFSPMRKTDLRPKSEDFDNLVTFWSR